MPTWNCSGATTCGSIADMADSMPASATKATSRREGSSADANGFSRTINASSLADTTMTGTSMPRCVAMAAEMSAASFFGTPLPALKTTLPLLSSVVTSA